MNNSIKYYHSLIFMVPFFMLNIAYAKNDISERISAAEFTSYKDVGEFIDHAPKVTIVVSAQQSDIDEYGQGVVKTLTGVDCDRDGKMDDNQTCNAVYYKLWLKYHLKK